MTQFRFHGSVAIASKARLPSQSACPTPRGGLHAQRTVCSEHRPARPEPGIRLRHEIRPRREVRSTFGAVAGIVHRRVDRRLGSAWEEDVDQIVEESPLEIRLDNRPLAVVMRTPGHDADLVLGFALTEGILLEPGEFAGIEQIDDNRVDLRLAAGIEVDPTRFQRNFYSTSSCGVCGKASIDAVLVSAGTIASDLRLPAGVVRRFPDTMRARQINFAATGGLHAATAMTASGELVALREDVGRHNAVDKLVGSLAPDHWRFDEFVLFVSGRISFEVIQKAAVAGFPIVCGISAASSLAVELGEELGMAVVGFVRDENFTVYTGRERLD